MERDFQVLESRAYSVPFYRVDFYQLARDAGRNTPGWYWDHDGFGAPLETPFEVESAAKAVMTPEQQRMVEVNLENFHMNREKSWGKFHAFVMEVEEDLTNAAL